MASGETQSPGESWRELIAVMNANDQAKIDYREHGMRLAFLDVLQAAGVELTSVQIETVGHTFQQFVDNNIHII